MTSHPQKKAKFELFYSLEANRFYQASPEDRTQFPILRIAGLSRQCVPGGVHLLIVLPLWPLLRFWRNLLRILINFLKLECPTNIVNQLKGWNYFHRIQHCSGVGRIIAGVSRRLEVFVPIPHLSKLLISCTSWLSGNLGRISSSLSSSSWGPFHHSPPTDPSNVLLTHPDTAGSSCRTVLLKLHAFHILLLYSD